MKDSKGYGGEAGSSGGDALLADFAHKALDLAREEFADAYEQLVRAHEGQAAAVGVFGVGGVTVAVQDGEVHVNPGERTPPLTARGATYPEVIKAVARGEVTVLDAFHRGDIIAQTKDPQQLHEAFAAYTKYSGEVLQSERALELLREFESAIGA